MTSAGAWSAASEPASLRLRASTALTAAQRALAASPDDPSPQCTTVVKATRYLWTRVGEPHRWYGVTSHFTYEAEADTEIGVEYQSPDIRGWTFEGDIHIANSGDRSNSITDGNPYGGQYILSQFKYVKTLTTWNGVGLCAPGWTIRSAGWNAGMIRGGVDAGTRDGLCNQFDPGIRSREGPTGHVSWTSRHGIHWGAVVTTPWGVKLDGRSGYTNTINVYAYFHHASYYCSDSTLYPLGDTKHVHGFAVGPEY